MTRGAYLEFCASLPGAVLDQPFEADFDSVVVRHGDTRKWFALVTCRQEQTWINLKCDPKPDDAADALAVAVTHAQTNTRLMHTEY